MFLYPRSSQSKKDLYTKPPPYLKLFQKDRKSRLEVFCKKNVLKIFRKITKKPVVGSCFSKVTGFSFLPAPLLKWGTTKGVWKTSAQHSLFLEAQTFIHFRYIKSQIGSNSKTSKNLNMVSHFHWNHFYQCYFFPRILFLFFLSYVSFLSSLRID